MKAPDLLCTSRVSTFRAAGFQEEISPALPFFFSFLTRVTRSFQVPPPGWLGDFLDCSVFFHVSLRRSNTLREQRNKRTRRIWSNPLAVRQQCCPLYRDKESTKTRNYSIFWGGVECTTYWFMLLFIQTPNKLLKGDQNQQKLCLACLFYALAPQQATISSRSIIDVPSTAVAVSLPKRTNVNGKKTHFLNQRLVRAAIRTLTCDTMIPTTTNLGSGRSPWAS